MPTYEYRCEKCGKEFSAVMTIAKHEKRGTKCPECKSKKLQQKLGSFFAKTSRKS